MKVKKATRNLLIVLLVAILLWSAYLWMIEKLANALDSSGRANLSSIVTAEKAFFAEYGKYTSDFEAVGYSLEGGFSYTQIFHSREQVPSEYLKVLKENEMPFVSDKSFRFLLALKNRHSKKIRFWTADDEKNIRLLESYVEFRE